MAINFPNSPQVNDTYVDPTSGFTYQWDGTVWKNYTYQRVSPALVALLTVYGRNSNTEILLNIPSGGLEVITPGGVTVGSDIDVTSSLFN